MMQLSLRKNLSLVYTCYRTTGKIKTDLPVGFCSAGGDVDEKRESAGKGQLLHVCDPEKLCFPTGWVCGGRRFFGCCGLQLFLPRSLFSLKKKRFVNIYIKKTKNRLHREIVDISRAQLYFFRGKKYLFLGLLCAAATVSCRCSCSCSCSGTWEVGCR